VAAFAEIYRVLKPGALFWGQEMCMTARFDPGDNRHQAIKKDLMHGIALKDIATMGEVNRTLETAGFQVVEGRDQAVQENGPATPWYQPMETRGGPFGSAFRRTPMGRKALKWGSRMFEYLGVFPKGSTEVVSLLDRTASAYVAGGRAGIFTPLYCFVARRPLRG
jgi:sterol 24-C-methyltransferase